MICMVHTRMLYMTGTQGTFTDGNVYNMQGVNRNLSCEQSRGAYNADPLFVCFRERQKIRAE
jgi:hypothetical protein